MNEVMESRTIVLSAPSGLFFVGPDAADPWLDDARQAMRFASASEAWRAAQDLVQAQRAFLDGDPVVLERYDPVANEASRLFSTDATYPGLRGQWWRALGEPLPLDIPALPDTPEVARARLSDYLNATDWQCVRTRGGDAFGFDPSFWVAADQLFQSDRAAFRSFWSSVVPPDIPVPDLSSPRWRSLRAAAGSREEPNAVIQAVAAPSVTPDDSVASKPAAQTPVYVTRHFVESRGAFYYKQRPDVLAFSSRGQSFRARDDSVMTATAIIELAQQRGWSCVRVRGSAAFRRAVWTAASERGIGVFGYLPTRGETAVLAQSASPDGHPARSDGSKRPVSDRSSDPFLGVVVALGSAPYQHDRANAESFFVTLRAADGQEHTHWGVGLQKAIEQAAVARGDRVSLERLGTESVAVDRPVLDAKGDVSYKKKELVERRVWNVLVVDEARQVSPASVATQIPSGASADPELATAMAVALIEKRMPPLSEAQRQAFRRHFDAVYERLGKSPQPDAPARDRSSQPAARRARGR
ncbi:MAG: LPD7 domain-containing protein [Thiohalocapsa sp.]